MADRINLSATPVDWHAVAEHERDEKERAAELAAVKEAHLRRHMEIVQAQRQLVIAYLARIQHPPRYRRFRRWLRNQRGKLSLRVKE